MATLQESAIFEEGIFQLEKSTPPLGGPPYFSGSTPNAGHANAQALQLANRTLFLKNVTDQITQLSATLLGAQRQTEGASPQSLGQRLDRIVVNIEEFGVVVGDVSYAQAELNQQAINLASLYVYSMGGGVLNYPAGIVGVRRKSAASSLSDSYCLLLPGVYHNGKGINSTTVRRMGPTTVYYADTTKNSQCGGIANMTIDGNPGIVGFTKFQSNLVYLEKTSNFLFMDTRFKDCPGLHCADINGGENIVFIRPKFNGYDLSLRGSDTTYLPESVQIGRDPTTFKPAQNIVILFPEFSASENYQAPLVGVGNHTGGMGTGPGVVGFTMEDAKATGIVNYLVRAKAWEDVKVIRPKNVASLGQLLYLDSKPAGTLDGQPTPIVACKDVILQDAYHDGDGPMLTSSVMSTTADPGTRHTNVRVNGGNIIGRAASNGIDISFVDDIEIRNLKARGCRRTVSARWCSNGKIIDPDWAVHAVNGLEITDSTGANSGKGYNTGWIIKGGKIKDSQNYGMYIGALSDYLIEGVDVSGSALASGQQSAIELYAGCNNGITRNVRSRNKGDTFIPLKGINITSGANNIVDRCYVWCSDEMVVNNGTGNSYESRIETWGSAPPTTGDYRTGDYRHKAPAVVGTPKGWLCTAGSKTTGGTWTSVGNL